MLAKQQIQRSFNHFNPRNYLKDYYSYVEPDEIKTIAFEIEIFRVIHRLFGQVKILEYGSGPTHHHTIPLSPYVGEIDIAESEGWTQEYINTNRLSGESSLDFRIRLLKES